MDKTTLAAVILIVGIVVLIESLFADPIGIGFNPSFGYNQAIGTTVGAILTAGGLWLLVRSR
jgi:hypothetical protein